MSSPTEAVEAVQLENKKLKSDLTELTKMKEMMNREFNEKKDMEMIREKKDLEVMREKETETRREREMKERCSSRVRNSVRSDDTQYSREMVGGEGEWREKDKDRGRARGASKLFVSPPTSPVSFVSRAICEIEMKSPPNARYGLI